MKMLLFGISLILALASCDDNKTIPPDAQLTLLRSATEYNNVLNGSQEARGNPYNILDFRIDGDSAFISLSYAGGCNPHTFEVIWSESYAESYPPQTSILLLHDSHGDACKALITETLAFDLARLTGPIDYEKVVVNLLNANQPALSGVKAEWKPSNINVYSVVFPEGDQCQVEVTAESAICGAGLWYNLWFALNDSVSAGVDGTYFRKWLQPVAISDNLKGFKPVMGKKYLVGARVQKDHPYNDIIVCLAYPGPSVPVKITCITELK
ncbi:MAG TPA: hypothetical protein VK207_01200 [Bacteroidales bacterium]|nr:hypothetical protein [Bacteroidales bacterium]